MVRSLYFVRYYYYDFHYVQAATCGKYKVLNLNNMYNNIQYQIALRTHVPNITPIIIIISTTVIIPARLTEQCAFCPVSSRFNTVRGRGVPYKSRIRVERFPLLARKSVVMVSLARPFSAFLI